MILGLCGLIGSGKGTVGDILESDYNFKKISFAKPLKDATSILFNWDRDLLEGETQESRIWRETEDSYWSQELGYHVTPRMILQKFGTECMRYGLHDNIWISILKKELLSNTNTNYVITDVRFKNEIKMIYSIGGYMWNIERTLPDWYISYVETGIIPRGIHQSEWDWILEEKNSYIKNTSDLENLKKQIDININTLYTTHSK